MRLAFILTAVVVTVSIASLAAARPGDLDPTFGSNGEVATPPGDVVADVRIAQDAAGRTLIVAARRVGLGDTLEVGVVRVDANGVIDATFGDGGLARVTTAPGRPLEALVAFAVMADGRAFVAVTGHVFDALDPPRGVLTIYRLTSEGGVDLDFGAVQLAARDVGVGASDLLVHADGRFDVATWYCDQAERCSLVVDRQAADGGPLDEILVPNDLADVIDVRPLLQPDGRVIAAARVRDGSGFSLVLTRYESDGQVDGSFGTGGRVHTGIPLAAEYGPTLAIAPDGALVVTGWDGGTMIVARFDASGRPDREFGVEGRVEIHVANQPETVANDLVLSPDGRIVIAGGAGVHRKGDHWFVAVLRADGSLDPDFGAGGVVVRNPAAFDGAALRVVLQPDGRLVVLDVGFTLGRYLGFPRACADANGDTAITVTDGVQVLRAAAGLVSSCLIDFCDTDGGGDVTVTDGVRTLRAAAALPVDLRCFP